MNRSAGTSFRRLRWLALAAALAVGVVFAIAGGAFADTVVNNLGATVTSMDLTAGGSDGSVQFELNPTNNDAKNGCNLTGTGSQLVVGLASDNTSVATVGASTVTIPGCSALSSAISVHPVAAGTAHITVSFGSVTTASPATSSSDYDLSGAGFTVNVSNPTVTDETAPSITFSTSPAAPDGQAGWFVNSPVTLTVQASDGDDNVSSIDCTVDGSSVSLSNLSGIGSSGTASGDISISSDGDRAIACTATDSHSNTTDPAATTDLKLDTVAPSLAPSVSPNPVLLNGSATASANATDDTSHVASSSCDAVDTSSLGQHSVTCYATDNAGNSAQQSVDYLVTAQFSGFLSPLSPDPAHVNLGNSGRTYPIKWQLTDANGAYITNAVSGTTIAVNKISCVSISTDAGDPIDYTASGGSQLRYDSTANQYVYNWATPSTKNTCYRLTVTTPDTLPHVALFQMK